MAFCGQVKCLCGWLNDVTRADRRAWYQEPDQQVTEQDSANFQNEALCDVSRERMCGMEPHIPDESQVPNFASTLRLSIVSTGPNDFVCSLTVPNSIVMFVSLTVTKCNKLHASRGRGYDDRNTMGRSRSEVIPACV
jgi:hypothetical protein